MAVSNKVRQLPNEPQSTQSAEPSGGPFIRYAREHDEFIFDTGSVALGSSEVNEGPFDVKAIGYLRAAYLKATASGGTLGAGALAADAPFNALDQLQLLDTNGTPIIDHLDGYALYLVNEFGGRRWHSKIEDQYDAVVSGNANFVFAERLPLELDSSGFGSLPNEDASAVYRVRFAINTQSAIFSTAPTTYPTVDVTGYEEVWTRPLTGPAQPPDLGTTCYITSMVYTVNAGANTIQMKRLGQWYRSLYLIFRNTTPARADLPGGNELRVNIDGVMVTAKLASKWRNDIIEQTGLSLPTGVYQIPYFRDPNGHQSPGDDSELWLPTTQSTRYELQFTASAAGTLQVVTEDVIPVGGVPYGAGK